MSLFSVLTSREEENLVLTNIIQKLNISEEEKQLYILSLTILDDTDFKNFFMKIQDQIQNTTSTIAPFSNQLI